MLYQVFITEAHESIACPGIIRTDMLRNGHPVGGEAILAIIDFPMIRACNCRCMAHTMTEWWWPSRHSGK
jgi:hypothetical protein